MRSCKPGKTRMSRREKLIAQLAAEMVAAEPGILTEDDGPRLQRYLSARCAQYLMDRANDTRVEVANRLIRKRDDGVAWTADEQAQAAYFGVRA